MKKLFALIFCLVASGVSHAGVISTRSTAPTTCAIGDVWINPVAATNDRIYTCTAPNTWTKNSGRPWVTQHTAPSDLSLIWFDDDQVPGKVVLKLHNGTAWIEQAIGEGGSLTYPGAGIAYTTTGTSWATSLTLDTDLSTVSPSDDSVASAKATKAALDDLPSLSAGTGITITADGGGAGVDTIGVTTNTYQAYDANMITWPSTISATEVGYLNGLTEAISTSLSGKQAADPQLDTWASITPGTGVATAIAANIGAVGGLRRIVAKGPSSLATAAISENTCSLQSFDATNVVAATDKPEAWISGRLSTVAGFGVTSVGALRIDVFLTDGYINFDVCNNTSASITPGALTIQWDVTR